MIDSPGELIRDARRRKGLSPEEVFRIARVRPGLLENVEEDVLTALPEDPYARGLYASLARAVGADVDRVLAAYDRVRSARTVTAFREPVREEPSGPQGPRPLAPIFIAVAAVLLVAGLVWIGGHREAGSGSGGAGGPGAPSANDGLAPGGQGTSTEPTAALDSFMLASPGAPLAAVAPETTGAAPAPASDNGADAGEDAPPPPPTDAADGGETPRDSLAVKVERAAGINEGAGAPAGAAGSATSGLAGQGATVQPLDSDTPALPGVTVRERALILEAKAVRDTWMRVVIDDVRTRAGILPAGETRSWRGSRELHLDIAAVENVRFRLNGRPVDIGEPRRGMGHFVLRWDQP